MARSSNGVEDIDIWRTAKILIDSHGEGAWLEAAQRADRGVEDGNADVVRVWKLAPRAVGELQREKPNAGEPLN
jgi:hypothetical protein